MEKVYAKKLHTVVAREAPGDIDNRKDRFFFNLLFHTQATLPFFERTIEGLRDWANRRSPKQIASTALSHLPTTLKTYRAARERVVKRKPATPERECEVWRQELGLSAQPSQKQIHDIIDGFIQAVVGLAPEKDRPFIIREMIKGGPEKLEITLKRLVATSHIDPYVKELRQEQQKLREQISQLDSLDLVLTENIRQVKANVIGAPTDNPWEELQDLIDAFDATLPEQVKAKHQLQGAAKTLDRGLDALKPAIARAKALLETGVENRQRQIDTLLVRSAQIEPLFSLEGYRKFLDEKIDLETFLLEKVLEQIHPEIERLREKVRSIRLIGRLLWVIVRAIGRWLGMRYYGVDSVDKLAKRVVKRAVADARGPLLHHILTQTGKQLAQHVLPKTGNPTVESDFYLGQTLRELIQFPIDWIRPDRPIPQWALSMGLRKVKAEAKTLETNFDLPQFVNQAATKLIQGWATDKPLRDTLVGALKIGIREGVIDPDIRNLQEADNNIDAVLHEAVIVALRNVIPLLLDGENATARKILRAKTDPDFAQQERKRIIQLRKREYDRIKVQQKYLGQVLRELTPRQDRKWVWKEVLKVSRNEKQWARRFHTFLKPTEADEIKERLKEESGTDKALAFLKNRWATLMRTQRHHGEMLRSLQSGDVVDMLKKEYASVHATAVENLRAKQGMGSPSEQARRQERLVEREAVLRDKTLKDPYLLLKRDGEWLFHLGMGALMQLVEKGGE